MTKVPKALVRLPVRMAQQINHLRERQLRPSSVKVYGPMAFITDNASPDRSFWQEFESKMSGQYFPKSAMETVAGKVDHYLPQQGLILELMCGRFSYVKPLPGRKVHGVGLVRESLEQNEGLTSFNVQDLNNFPEVALNRPAQAAIIPFGIAYSLRPLELLAAVSATLDPGSKIILTCSEHCYKVSKAPLIWRNSRWGVNLGGPSFTNTRILVEDYIVKSGLRLVESKVIEDVHTLDYDMYMVVGQKK